MSKPTPHPFAQLYPPARFSSELGGPVPRALLNAEEMIINQELLYAVRSSPIDAVKIHNLLDAAVKWKFKLDTEGIGYAFKQNMEQMMAALSADPEDLGRLQRTAEAVKLARGLPFTVTFSLKTSVIRPFVALTF